MLSFNVKADLREVQKYLNDLQKKYVPQAAGTALRRVATTVRKIAQQRIRDRLAISAAVARGDLQIERGPIGRLTVWVTASGKPIPLRDYQARQTRKGATYRVSKANGRKTYQRQQRLGFIVRSKGGHVFVRTGDDPPGKAKAPIQKVYGPSLPQYFVTKLVVQAMQNTARERWQIEFSAALRGVLLRRTGTDIGQGFISS